LEGDPKHTLKNPPPEGWTKRGRRGPAKVVAVKGEQKTRAYSKKTGTKRGGPEGDKNKPQYAAEERALTGKRKGIKTKGAWPLTN